MLITAPSRLGRRSIVVIFMNFFMHDHFLEARQRRTRFGASLQDRAQNREEPKTVGEEKEDHLRKVLG